MEFAELALAELRQGVELHIGVVGNEQVEPPVAVVVGERRAGGPSRIPDSRLRGHIGECAVTVVVIQPVRTVAGHVEIVPAVVVEVGGNGPHAPAWVAHTCLVRRVLERAVAPVTPQLAAGASGIAGCRDRRRVDEIHVEPAVLVEVEEGYASAHGFEDVLLLGRRRVREGDAALCRDVRERNVLGCARGHDRQIRGDGSRGARHISPWARSRDHLGVLGSSACGVTSGFVSGTAAVRRAARLRSRLNSASAFSCCAVSPSARYACDA